MNRILPILILFYLYINILQLFFYQLLGLEVFENSADAVQMPYKFSIFVPKIKPNRMATFSYRIRTTRKGILTKVLIRFNVDRHTSFYADTQYLVLSDAWDDKKQTVKSRFTFTDDFTEQQGRELTKNLSELRSHILGEIAKDLEHAMTKTRLEKIIYSFHHPRSLTTGRRVRTRESLGDYIARFTREMEEGTRLNIHKLRYGPSTIKNYKGFVVQFDEYCKAKRKQFDFADIDLKFYDDFVAWFTAKNYSVNTIGRHVKELKIIMRAAREEGLHDNGAIESRKFRVLTADVENIYLTESEIRAIAALDLSKNWHKDVARDIFLVGCYTAQRFSDYSTINEGNIRTLENGQQVIDLKQQKTGNHVVIPVRPELQAILEKYDNRLPRTYEQKVNHLIKEIAREAGITEKVEVSYIENGEKKSRLVEKCDLVKTHTARRSGATNMYLAGIPTIAIMKVTGHKTEREFMKYIKITEEQTALELMSHPYFSGASNTTR